MQTKNPPTIWLQLTRGDLAKLITKAVQIGILRLYNGATDKQLPLEADVVDLEVSDHRNAALVALDHPDFPPWKGFRQYLEVEWLI